MLDGIDEFINLKTDKRYCLKIFVVCIIYGDSLAECIYKPTASQ